MKIVKHATVAAIEKQLPSEGDRTVLYLRGYLNGEAFDACFFVDPDNPPFEKGDIVTVTMEVKKTNKYADQPDLR